MQAGYICRLCHTDRLVEVRERAKDEGVENYVYHCGRMAGEDHHRHSPECRAEAFDLRVPMTSNGIGVPGDPLTAEEIRDLKERLK